MTSAAKAAANRRNAQRSTGPRTAAGKARVARNAFRHGLSIPMRTDLTDWMASEYAGAFHTEFGGTNRELVVRAAEGQDALLRVRAIRADLLNRDAARLQERDMSLTKGECIAMAFMRQAKVLEALDRYERRALSKRRRSLRKLRGTPLRSANTPAGDG